MGQIRVLVADDSALARELIIAILSTDNEINVIGQAKNGREAVEMVKELRPDILTLDIEMPLMNGLDAIELIMGNHPLPILVVTTRGDAHTAYSAISKGALDLVVKPDINLEEAREFIQKIKLLSKIKVITHITGKRTLMERTPEKPAAFTGTTSDGVVAIATSTGGPEALSVILSSLPEAIPCPIVVAQHNSDGFIPGLVEWLDRLTKLRVKVAEQGEVIQPGTVYVSPSEIHTEISPTRRVSFIERHPADIYRPSCDRLLSSVAIAFKEKSIGIILTGMGSDGVRGMMRIKEAGGTTIAQDEKTCIVYGMPKVAIDSGCIDQVLPLEKIGGRVVSLLTGRGRSRLVQA
ncbi:MAG: chemotaxis-specific protein-glutamate methyltransferase CheB [Desulfobacteraceae bacterium]|nr:MAG: chemotaxis-specific protein-glutamate methyltransferase CheB [Desulfobacteraceae bacterium]